jgi:hypothetical protein
LADQGIGLLGERSDGKGRTGEEAMGTLMVLVLRNYQRSQSIGIQKICHPSFKVAAISSAVMRTPSFRASGIPWRLPTLDEGSGMALRISSDAASSRVIFLSRETDLTIRAAAGLRRRGRSRTFEYAGRSHGVVDRVGHGVDQFIGGGADTSSEPVTPAGL